MEKTESSEIYVSLEQVMKRIGVNIATVTDIYNKTKEDAHNKGLRLRRTPFDSLTEKNLMVPRLLLAEYQKIQRRESNLSASEREYVRLIVARSIHESLKKQIKLQQEHTTKGVHVKESESEKRKS